jgi:hypothetical protein
MKIDYLYLRQIVNTLENNEKYEMSNIDIIKKINININNDLELDKFIGHIKILNDIGCIESINLDMGFRKNFSKDISCCETDYRLTAKGYEFLDLLMNDTVINKIKNFSISTALEIGKQFLIKSIVNQ